MTYANYEFYINNGGTLLTEETAEKALKKASDTIDILTYNRIYVIGFAKLTDFQQTIVKMVCCALADWQTQNSDILDSPLTGYSINGVSVQFAKSANVANENGVSIPSALLSRLRTTGLTWGAIV